MMGITKKIFYPSYIKKNPLRGVLFLLTSQPKYYKQKMKNKRE
jgi:hypothetical protein